MGHLLCKNVMFRKNCLLCCFCNCCYCKFCHQLFCVNGNIHRGHNSVGVKPEKKIKILLLGLTDSGKTEIGHHLSKIKRVDYEPTNGAHSYTIRHFMNIECSLTEVGGNKDMQRIWHHYYMTSMGLIYCFDMSASYEHIQSSFEKLYDILQSPYLKGKPVLVVATKSDLVENDSIQLYDIENVFHMEQMAKMYECNFKLCYSNKAVNDLNLNLINGFKWLMKYLCSHYSTIEKRLKCDRNLKIWELNDKQNQCNYEQWLRPLTAPAAINIYSINSIASIEYKSQMPNISQLCNGHPYKNSSEKCTEII